MSLSIDAVLADLGAKLNSGFAAIKTSVENFHVLQDSAAAAIKARDDARAALAKNLDDLQASITAIRAQLEDSPAVAPGGGAAPASVPPAAPGVA